MKLTQCFAFETITVSNTAIGLTTATYDPPGSNYRAMRAVLSVESQSIRVRWDGTAPTASVGHILSDGQWLTVDGDTDLSQLKMIRKDGSDATVRVSYER